MSNETNRRGRPRNLRGRVINLIGVAGIDALERNDLFVVSGAALRELGLFLKAKDTNKKDNDNGNEPTGEVASEDGASRLSAAGQ